jgi:rhamnosyltransferase subunit B
VTSGAPVAFVVWGSLGDLHPFLGVARALRERGTDSIIATHEEYRAKVEAEGFSFRPVRPSFADLEAGFGADRATITRQLIERPLWLFERAIFPFLRASVEDARALLDETPWLVTSSPAIGARLAAEERGVDWLAAVLQPMQFLSDYDPPALMPMEWLAPLIHRLGPRAAQAHNGLVRLVMRRIARPVADLRAELGLKAQPADPVFQGQFGRAGALALYSPVLATVQRDYPPGVMLTGFPFYDSEHGGGSEAEPGLRRFLDAGPAPVVFTLGSSFVYSPGRFYRDSAAAARALGVRAVLLVGEHARDRYAGLADDHCYVGGYAPYSTVFPRASVVVHQGGIGTLGQALRAGRPELVVPFFGDQADNARRAVRLGVGRVLGRRGYSPGRVARLLGQLLSEPSFAAAAADVAARLGGEQGAARAAVCIERWRAGASPR